MIERVRISSDKKLMGIMMIENDYKLEDKMI